MLDIQLKLTRIKEILRAKKSKETANEPLVITMTIHILARFFRGAAWGHAADKKRKERTIAIGPMNATRTVSS